MKKRISILLLIALLVSLAAPLMAAADSTVWYCPRCGRKNTENFCPKDGVARPSDMGGNSDSGETVRLSDLAYTQKYGKIWYHQKAALGVATNSDWRNYSYPGQVTNVTDVFGNTYSHGFHLDGDLVDGKPVPFYVDVELDGRFTEFSGVFSTYAGTETDGGLTQMVTFYADGKWIYNTVNRSKYSGATPFSVNVTGVQTLRIYYNSSRAPHDIAVIYDGTFR